MNDSEIWKQLKILKEIRARVRIAVMDNEVEEFIRTYILDNKDDKDALLCLGFVIRELHPNHVEYMNKLIILI